MISAQPASENEPYLPRILTSTRDWNDHRPADLHIRDVEKQRCLHLYQGEDVRKGAPQRRAPRFCPFLNVCSRGAQTKMRLFAFALTLLLVKAGSDSTLKSRENVDFRDNNRPISKSFIVEFAPVSMHSALLQ